MVGGETSPAKPTLEEQVRRLVNVVRVRTKQNGQPPNIAGIGGMFVGAYPDFQPSNYGMERFGDLAKYAEERGELEIIRSGTQRLIGLPRENETVALQSEVPSSEPSVLSQPAPTTSSMQQEVVFDILVRLVRQAHQAGREARYTWLGAELRRELPGFTPEGWGFPSFSAMMNLAGKSGRIQVLYRNGTTSAAFPVGAEVPHPDAAPGSGMGQNAATSQQRVREGALLSCPGALTCLIARAYALEQEGISYTVTYLANNVVQSGVLFPADVLETDKSTVHGGVDVSVSSTGVRRMVMEAVTVGFFQRSEATNPLGQQTTYIRLDRSRPEIADFMSRDEEMPLSLSDG